MPGFETNSQSIMSENELLPEQNWEMSKEKVSKLLDFLKNKSTTPQAKQLETFLNTYSQNGKLLNEWFKINNDYLNNIITNIYRWNLFSFDKKIGQFLSAQRDIQAFSENADNNYKSECREVINQTKNACNGLKTEVQKNVIPLVNKQILTDNVWIDYKGNNVLKIWNNEYGFILPYGWLIEWLNIVGDQLTINVTALWRRALVWPYSVKEFSNNILTWNTVLQTAYWDVKITKKI